MTLKCQYSNTGSAICLCRPLCPSFFPSFLLLLFAPGRISQRNQNRPRAKYERAFVRRERTLSSTRLGRGKSCTFLSNTKEKDTNQEVTINEVTFNTKEEKQPIEIRHLTSTKMYLTSHVSGAAGSCTAPIRCYNVIPRRVGTVQTPPPPILGEQPVTCNLGQLDIGSDCGKEGSSGSRGPFVV